MKPNQKLCSECGRERERCRAATQMPDGTILWVCRQCWNDLEYDRFLYEYRQKEQTQ